MMLSLYTVHTKDNELDGQVDGLDYMKRQCDMDSYFYRIKGYPVKIGIHVILVLILPLDFSLLTPIFSRIHECFTALPKVM